MTARFRFAFAALALAAAAVLLIALFTGVFESETGNPSDVDVGEAGPDAGIEGPITVDDPNAGLTGNPDAAPVEVTGSGMQPGMRTPHGLDLSDPAQRLEYMLELINAFETDWDELTRVLRVETGVLPAEIREFLISELATGRKLGVLQAFAVIQDGTMTHDLVVLLDDLDLSHRAKRAVLQALYTMPGADANEVVLELEGRLTDDMSRDRGMLHAIASRGGPEAARAIIDYLRRSGEPDKVAQFVLQALDIENDPEAAAVVKEALAAEDVSSGVRNRLLLLVGRAGATEFTPLVIAIDADGHDRAARERALETLAKIGGEDAIKHLLDRAGQPGTLGDAALKWIGRVNSSDLEGRSVLVEALDDVGGGLRPIETTEQLLSALANLRENAAAPKFVEYMTHPTTSVQHEAIRGLARLGSSAEEHVPKLVDLFSVSEERTRVRIAVALGSIGGEEAVKAMEQMVAADGIPPDLNRTLRMGLLDAKRRLKSGSEGNRGGVPAQPRPNLGGK